MEFYEGPNIRHPDSDFDGLLDGRNATVDNDSALFDYYVSYELPYIDNGNGTSTFVGEKSINTHPLKTDSDTDNIKDATEVFGYNVTIKRANGSVEEKYVYTDPANEDSDNDELIDGRELSFRTDPTHPDADADSLIDGHNVTATNGSAMFQYFDNLGILYLDNGDGTVTFVGELTVGASPTNNESDSDGIPDLSEVFVYGTQPATVDTDQDGLPDGYEVFYGFNPLNNATTENDYDSDNYTNVYEYMYGTDPSYWDTDFDGMSDAWEWQFGLRPLDNGTDMYERKHNISLNLWYYDVLQNEGNITRGPEGDLDNDNLTNLEEYGYMKSTDWDETTDGTWWSGLNPNDWDTDSDNVSDLIEVKDGTYWWEAENYTTNDVVNDSANFASYGSAAQGTDSDPTVFWINWSLPSPTTDYKLYIKARKTSGTDASLEVYDGTDLLFTATVDNQTYNWYNSSSECDISGSGQVSIKGKDVNGTEPSLYVDKVLLVAYDTIMVNKVYDGDTDHSSLTFDMDVTSEVYIRIPVWGSQKRYVTNATMVISGSDDPTAWNVTMNVGDKVPSKGLQWYFAGEFKGDKWSYTIDLAGEFNQYLANHTDEMDGDNDGNVSIPLKFGHNVVGENGEITISEVHVLLAPYVTDPLDNDTDSDWLDDGRERLRFNTSSLEPDSDNDEITDWSEVNEDQDGEPKNGTQLTDPTDSDTDDDLLDDLDDPFPTIADMDYDGRIDGIENRTGTLPYDPDTDNDGLLDGFDVIVNHTCDAWWSLVNITGLLNESINATHTRFFGELSAGTSPVSTDSDGDGLSDGYEFIGVTDPSNPDTDGDGLLDGDNITIGQSDWRHKLFSSIGVVVMNGTFMGENYSMTDSSKSDTDGDGMPDGWEVKFWLDPNDGNGKHGAEGDLDEDNVTNLNEYYHQSNPKSSDTDFDTLPDGWEITYGLDPLHNGTDKYILTTSYEYNTVTNTSTCDGPNGDPDDDSFLNSLEFSYGTLPSDADSDGDGLIDGNTTEIERDTRTFKLWEAQGIPYIALSGYTVRFLGEGEQDTNRTNPDSDFDSATDGQELHGYNVMISWYEGDDLKSTNKTIYGHPWGAYKQTDNSTYLDVDEDGITDVDEIDPANSTTESVMEFMEHFKDDQEMLDGQFNPFIRESTPPVVINVKVKTHENWETVWVGFIPVPTLKRAWAEIDMEMIDVAKFYVTVKISPGRIAHFEGEGHEWFKAELDLHLLELMGKYTVRIEMVDISGNELDPPYEEEVDGWFGGVLRMLEALWDFICSVVSAIAEAVAKALSFLLDMIMAVVMELIQLALVPVFDTVGDWLGSVYLAVDRMMSIGDTDYVDAKTLHQIIFLSPFTDIVLRVAVVIMIVIAIIAVVALLIPGVGAAMSAIGSLFKNAVSSVVASAASAFGFAMSAAAGLIIGIVMTNLIPNNPAWDVVTATGSLFVTTLILTIQFGMAWKVGVGSFTLMDGDIFGIILAIVGFLLTIGWSFLPANERGENQGLYSVIGLTLAFWGMILGWGTKSWTDTLLPEPWGMLDEFLGTALFGIAFTQATFKGSK
jgi:hypothetical protein